MTIKDVPTLASPSLNPMKVASPKRDWTQDYRIEPEWKKGLASAADELQALGGGMVGLAGQGAASVLPEFARPVAEDVREWGLDTYRENMAESIAGWQAPKVARVEDIKLGEEGGTERLGDWAAYQGAKGVATLASLALSGGVGGAIAKGATKQAVKHIAKAQVGKKVAGDVVTKKIKEQAQDEITRNVTRGAIAGGGAGAFALEGGGAFGQQVEEGVTPADAALPSAGVGLVNAALELVAPLSVAKKLGLGSWAMKGIGKAIKDDPAGLGKKAQRLAAKIAKGAGTTAAQEGITEAVQELVQIAGGRIAKDEELLSALSEEDQSQILNAAAAGGFTGMLVGGAAGPFMKTPEVRKEGETAEAAAAEAAQAEAATEGVDTVRQAAEEPTPAQVGEQPERPLLYADWLRETQERDVDSVTAEEAPGVYGQYQKYKAQFGEVQRDAEKIRKDQTSLYQAGRPDEGVQGQGSAGGEQPTQERGQAAGKVAQEELESRAAAVAKPVEQVERETAKELGRSWLGRAKKSGLFEVVDAEGPNGESASFNQTTGKITVYAKSLTEGSSAAQVLHEVSHANMDALTQGRLGEFAQEVTAQGEKDHESLAGRAVTQARAARMAWLAKQFGIEHDLWKTAGEEKTVEWQRVGKVIADEIKALPEAERQAMAEKADGILAEETFAYFVQYAHDAKAGKGLFRRAMNSIKSGWMLSDVGRTLGKAGLRPKINDGLAVELARRSSRFAVELREEMRRLGAKPVEIEEGADALASFAGMKAEGADTTALAWASKAINAGVDPEEVRQESGWSQGMDQKWRFEIDDSEAELQPEFAEQGDKFEVGGVALMDVLVHDKLFAAYPGLSSITVRGDINPDYAARSGSLRKENGEWILEYKAKSQEEFLKGLLHETQHGIQSIEGFAEGGDSNMFVADEILQSGKVEQWVDNIYKWRTQLYAEYQKARDKGDTERSLRLIGKVRRLGDQVRLLQAHANSEVGTKYAGYIRLAGEIEARNVQARADMTEAERQQVRPELTQDLPGESAIVVLNGKEVKNDLVPANAAIPPADLEDPLLSQTAEVLEAPMEATVRISDAMAIGQVVEQDSLNSQPASMTDAWLTDPLSSSPEEVNNPGFLNKLKTAYVDKFNDLWKMSEAAATKFNLARSKRSGEQKNFEADFVQPWINLAGDLLKGMSKGDKKFTIEDANDSFAAWHIVNDNVNQILAETNSNEEAIRLEKALDKHEGALEEGSELRKEIQKVRVSLAKGRRNLLKGLTWEGEQPKADDDITSRTMTVSEVRGKLKIEVDRAYDAVVGDTKIWKLEPITPLRLDWEGLKHHGSGFATPKTLSEDQEVRAQFEQKLDIIGRPQNAHEVYNRVKENGTFIQLAKEAKKIAHNAREQLVKGGLLPREEVDAMAKTYKHWVPLRRKAFDFQHAVDSQFQRMGGFGRGVNTRTGTSRIDKPVHAMQNLLANYDAAVTAAEANKARDFLAKQIEKDPGRWIDWFSVENDPEYKKSHGKYGFIQTHAAGGGPMDIPFYRDGERYYIKVEQRNQRAKTLSTAIRNLDSQELGPVMNVMNKVNSWIRWTNISASPAFLLMNAPRDYFTARLNLKATEIADYGKDVQREVMPSLKALVNHFLKGKKDAGILEWEHAGGRISFVESLRPNDESWGSLEAKIKHRQGDFNFGPGMEANLGAGVGEAVGTARNWLERIETINIIAENVMRYSVWKVAKAKGLSDDKAALMSKDITTNFDRRGLRAQTLGVYWLFFNATVQGNTQVLRNVFYGPNKQKLWGALGAVMATAFLNDQIGALTSEDEDKDGRSDWDSTPDWKKEKFARIAGSNLLWPGEDSGYATVPLPWVFNTVWRLGEMASEVTRGKKDPLEVPGDMAGLVLNTFNPIGSSDTTAAQMAAPTAFDPLVQIVENTSAFGRPLGPTRFPGQEFLPDSEMNWLSESKGYKWLAREVNKFTGGSPAEQGMVDWRPSTYRVLTDTLLGGGGRFFKQLANSAISPLTGDVPEVKDTPVLRTFFFTPGDPIESERYYERVAKVEQAKKAEKTFRVGPERDLQELQRIRGEYVTELKMIPMSKDVERQIKALRKQFRAAQAKGQENRTEMLKRKIDQAKERFNKAWDRRAR